MSIQFKAPELRELKPRIMVAGIGGAGGNAVNNMIASGLIGVDFIVANTDAQALTASRAERIIQMGLQVTEGLGAGSQPDVGRAAAEEAIEEIRDHLSGAHMCFVTAGMGGGTGTGAAPVIASVARDMGILTVGVVTKPFHFEGQRRMRVAEAGILELQEAVDTLIVIPNQNLFRVANEKTTFADAFGMADQVLYSGVACITDLMVKEGLINLDFADVRAIMREMGKAMMGTGEASGDRRAILAAEAAIANPLLDETSMKGARGLLISITGGSDLTLYEVDEAASRIRQEVDEEANIILGATFDDSLDGIVRVSVVATGIDHIEGVGELAPASSRIPDVSTRERRMNMARPAAPAQVPHQAEAARAPEGEKPHHPHDMQDADNAHGAHVSHVSHTSHVSHASHDDHDAWSTPANPTAPADAPSHGDMTDPRAFDPAAPTMRHGAVHASHNEAAPAFQQGAPAPHVQVDEYNEAPIRPVRMPQVEELPMPVQQQLRARQTGEGEANGAEQKRRSLLERLASFGINREAEPSSAVEARQQPPAAPQPVAPVVAPPPVQARPAAHPSAHPHAEPARQHAPAAGYHHPAPQAPAVPVAPQGPGPAHAAYGKRPAPAAQPGRQQAQLDLHGRQQPPARPLDDEQLEIPAFLRRQTG